MIVDGVDISEFSNLVKVSDLWESRYCMVPTDPGVYLVRRLTGTDAAFLPRSQAGFFKGKDPSYPIDNVVRNWIPSASIVYIGKGTGSRGLRQRIRQLIDFAHGKPVGHRGGRMLWHLKDWADLSLQWTTCPDDRADGLESSLIECFRQKRGERPFANMLK